jgi:hypothetical protein
MQLLQETWAVGKTGSEYQDSILYQADACLAMTAKMKEVLKTVIKRFSAVAKIHKTQS